MAMQSPYIPEISNHQKTKAFNQKVEKTFLDKKHAEEIRKLKETNSTPCEILGYHLKAINLNFSKYQIYEILDGIRQGHNLEPWEAEDAFVKITKYTYWNNFTNALKKLNGNVPKENVSSVDAFGHASVGRGVGIPIEIKQNEITNYQRLKSVGRGVGIPIEIKQNEITNYQRLNSRYRSSEEDFASIDIDSTGHFDYQKILSQYEISEPRDTPDGFLESIDISSALPDKSICTESIDISSALPDKSICTESIDISSALPDKSICTESIDISSALPDKSICTEFIDISSALPDKSICTVIRIAGDFIWLDFPDFEGDPTLQYIAYIPEKKQLLIY